MRFLAVRRAQSDCLLINKELAISQILFIRSKNVHYQKSNRGLSCLPFPFGWAASNMRFLAVRRAQSDCLLISKELGDQPNFIYPIQKCSLSKINSRSLLLAIPTWVAASNMRFLAMRQGQSDCLLISKELGGQPNFIYPIQKCSLSKIKREAVVCPRPQEPQPVDA
jgi:hypothetical protein